MISFVIVGVAASIAAGLTLYSGFGLGTLLMPVFALFFPVDVAVAATAIVHGANSAFKVGVVGRCADRALVVRFGLPAVVTAFLGALALGYASRFGASTSYELGAKVAVITPIKVVMAILMLVFASFDLLPRLRKLTFSRRYVLLGGILSGFFGGFSGHQGALRSAFLAKVGISTEAFVGTNAAIGFMVDAARIATYTTMFLLGRAAGPFGADEWPLVLVGIISALTGVMVGKRFLHKVTMGTVQTLTGVFLIGIALALGSGLV